MARPGISVTSSDIPPAATFTSPPINTGTLFLVGPTTSGTANTATKVHSVSEYVSSFGARDTGSHTYDALDVFFREGGTEAYVSKVAAGDYGAALAAFPKALGPGQVIAPGITDAGTQELLLDHAAANNRVALLDVPDSATIADLEAIGTAARTTDNPSYGAAFGPWVVVPGVTPGTTRKVPYSAVQAGLEARRDQSQSQNVPAAGRDFPLFYAVDLASDYTDANRETLMNAGINTAHAVYGVLETYGYRSLADPATTPNWVPFNNVRLRMAIIAEGEAVAESFMFAQIDGQGRVISQFGMEIAAMLLGFFAQGSLYGITPADSFRVEVGPSVNTPETLQNDELHAAAAVRMSPFAEEVVIEFVKVPITQGV